MGITITETRVQDQSSSALNTKDIINIVYPVGSIYMSVNSTSPALLFGGTWEQLKDRFLLASGDTYSAGSTGGEAQHTLTVDEMPSHRHSTYGDTDGFDIRTAIMYSKDAKGPVQSANNNSYWEVTQHQFHTSSAGGNVAHNNMPPYLTVYMWKRIA